ncbi:MAG: hypothetical protein ABIT70_05795, partial [Sulfuriferula sp.]
GAPDGALFYGNTLRTHPPCSLILNSNGEHHEHVHLDRVWYNPTRRHSGLGYLSLNNFERKLNEKIQSTINCIQLTQHELLSVE